MIPSLFVFPQSETTRKSFFLLSILLIYILSSLTGCAPAPTCNDPLGCARFQRGEPIRISIVAPEAGAAACPSSAEVLEALKSSFPKQDEELQRPYKIVIQESQSQPILAQQAANQSAEDPGMVAQFEIDCFNENAAVALTGVNAGIPTWINQYPDNQEIIPGLFSWLRSPAEEAQEIADLLLFVQVQSLHIIAAPLERAKNISQDLCAALNGAGQNCEVTRAEAGLNEISPEIITSDGKDTALLLIGPEDQLPTDLLSSEVTLGRIIIAYDPYFDSPGESTRSVQGMYWIGSENEASVDKTNFRSLEAAYAIQAGKDFQQALQRVAIQASDELLIPRSALIQQLLSDNGNPNGLWKCQDSTFCPPPVHKIYQFIDGNLIMVERPVGG